jgi:aminopeptidase N
MRILLSLLFISISTLAFSTEDVECFIQDPKGRSLDHNVDMHTMDLKVNFNPEEGIVYGQVTYRFSCLQPEVDTLFLHAPGIEIQSVLLDKVEIPFRTSEEGLIVEFDQTLGWGQPKTAAAGWFDETKSALKVHSDYELQIDYKATPQKGIYFIGWNDETGRMKKQIWTQGQGIDNRHWIPSYDHQNDKLITSVEVTFREGYEIISNGVQTFQKTESGEQTLRYEMEKPHSSYLVMLAIGEYDNKVLTANNGVPIYQYYYKGEEDHFEPTYRYSVEMMDWFEQELGVPYQWGKYANVPVADFLYGAMENTSATIFTDIYHRDAREAVDRDYVGTNAHELAHHWFGDLITAWGGTHHWLHESFATHYAKHFKLSVYGEDEFAWDRRNEMRSAWRANANNNLPIAHSEASSARHYPQGSIVLDMMRYVLGELNYRAAIQHYLEKHAFENVDSDDLRIAILERTGINLDWFFEEWVYKGGHPHFEVTQDIGSDSVKITVRQIHEQNSEVGLFEMPVYWEVYYADGSKSSRKVRVSGASHNFAMLKEDKEVAFVLFDPGWQILKDLSFEKTQDELLAQSLLAENIIDRYDAVLGLDSLENDEVMKHLIGLYETESFWSIRAQVVKQLSDFDDKKARKTLLAGLNDSNPQVRYTALNNLGTIKSSELKYVEPLLIDSSYRNVSAALEILTDSFPENAGDYLEKTKDLQGVAKEVRITWLLANYSFNPEETVAELVDLAGPSFEFRTRINAAKALQEINVINPELAVNLIDGCLSLNRRLAGPFKSVSGHFLDNEANREFFMTVYKAGSWNDRQQQILEKLFDFSDDGSGDED